MKYTVKAATSNEKIKNKEVDFTFEFDPSLTIGDLQELLMHKTSLTVQAQRMIRPHLAEYDKVTLKVELNGIVNPFSSSRKVGVVKEMTPQEMIAALIKEHGSAEDAIKALKTHK